MAAGIIARGRNGDMANCRQIIASAFILLASYPTITGEKVSNLVDARGCVNQNQSCSVTYLRAHQNHFMTYIVNGVKAKVLSVKWSFHCPRGSPNSTMAIAFDEYRGGWAKGKYIRHDQVVWHDAAPKTAAAGTTVRRVRGIDAIAVAIVAETYTVQMYRECPWRVVIRGNR
jgi:hypothetical protein